jgi:hypothetical protein
VCGKKDLLFEKKGVIIHVKHYNTLPDELGRSFLS